MEGFSDPMITLLDSLWLGKGKDFHAYDGQQCGRGVVLETKC